MSLKLQVSLIRAARSLAATLITLGIGALASSEFREAISEEPWSGVIVGLIPAGLLGLDKARRWVNSPEGSNQL
jgi:hypothetical protein|tara:strand:+ start:1037 stop:1258 length:222 start_codon:yes stop_codon:yes gene_type:complete